MKPDQLKFSRSIIKRGYKSFLKPSTHNAHVVDLTFDLYKGHRFIYFFNRVKLSAIFMAEGIVLQEVAKREEL